MAYSKRSRYGRAANGIPFLPENYRILHSYRTAGVVSMMKDSSHGGVQDSRFFMTVAPDASWADNKYCAFGVVTSGQDLINELRALPVEPPSNHPLTTVVIVQAGVLT